MSDVDLLQDCKLPLLIQNDKVDLPKLADSTAKSSRAPSLTSTTAGQVRNVVSPHACCGSDEQLPEVAQGLLPSVLSKCSVLRWLGFGAGLERGQKHSQWMQLSRADPNVAGLSGHTPRKGITLKEVRQHCSREDVWVILKDKVYNITPYLAYHPGGEDILMKVAGKDALPLFNKYHPWVNFEAVLANCLVGTLEPRDRLAEYAARYSRRSNSKWF